MKYGNNNRPATISMAIIPEILRAMKYVLLGSFVAFQLSNVFHISLGAIAFNNPLINIKPNISIGNSSIPFGIGIFSFQILFIFVLSLSSLARIESASKRNGNIR